MKNSEKSPNLRKINNTFFNNPCVKEEVTAKIRKYFELNRNEKTIYQNLWHAVKAVLRGKFAALNTYIRKREVSKINDVSFHLKRSGKEKQIKHKSEN